MKDPRLCKDWREWVDLTQIPSDTPSPEYMHELWLETKRHYTDMQAVIDKLYQTIERVKQALVEEVSANEVTERMLQLVDQEKRRG